LLDKLGKIHKCLFLYENEIAICLSLFTSRQCPTYRKARKSEQRIAISENRKAPAPICSAQGSFLLR
jgi:hypothetical protein